MVNQGNNWETKGNHLREVLGNYFLEPGWPRLAPRSFLVWSALVFEAAPVICVASVSFGGLRKLTGIGSNRTVSRGIEELIEKGYVRELDVGGGGNRSRVYQLLHHRFPVAGVRKEAISTRDRICAMVEELYAAG